MRIAPFVLLAVVLLVASPISSLAAFGMEDYAVYSVILANFPFTDTSLNQQLLIARETLDSPEIPSPSVICSKLSSDLKRRIEDVLAANHGYRRISGVLEKKFRIDRPYVLINSRQADQWRRRRSQPQVPTDPPDKENVDPFPESNLVQLSSVLFNAEKTLGMVYVSSSC